MEDFKKIVGKRIKAARQLAGYTSQGSFADAMDVDQSRVARWETGQNLPKGSHRKRLLELIKKTESDIFGMQVYSREHTVHPDVLDQLMKAAKLGAEEALARERTTSEDPLMQVVMREFSKAPLLRKLAALYLLTDDREYLERWKMEAMQAPQRALEFLRSMNQLKPKSSSR